MLGNVVDKTLLPGGCVKYRKKPVVIEAVQFIPGDPLPPGMKLWPNEKGAQPRDMSHGYIETLEGIMHVHAYDWVIKGIKGEFYPCKPDIFEATYEQAGLVAEDEELKILPGFLVKQLSKPNQYKCFLLLEIHAAQIAQEKAEQDGIEDEFHAGAKNGLNKALAKYKEFFKC